MLFVSPPSRMSTMILWVSLMISAWIVLAMTIASLFEAAELALDASQGWFSLSF